VLPDLVEVAGNLRWLWIASSYYLYHQNWLEQRRRRIGQILWSSL